MYPRERMPCRVLPSGGELPTGGSTSDGSKKGADGHGNPEWFTHKPSYYVTIINLLQL